MKYVFAKLNFDDGGHQTRIGWCLIVHGLPIVGFHAEVVRRNCIFILLIVKHFFFLASI